MLKLVTENRKIIYKDLPLASIEGCYSGPMMFIISIVSILIGPASIHFFPMPWTTYLALNIAGGVFFSFLYPPFAPVSGFSTIDVYEVNGEKFLMVGKIMGRKFRVTSISVEKEIEIICTRWKRRCYFKTALPASL